MSTYQPPAFDNPVDLDLSRNEGRPHLDGFDLDVSALGDLIRRYPDTATLASLVAERHGVEEDGVLVTAGGDDAIFRSLLWSRDRAVVTTTPTFEMISRYAGQVGVRLAEVSWWDGAPPVVAMARTGADVAVIVSPNNPTGSVIEIGDLAALADRFRFVVLDAAYVEFADIDLTQSALDLGNVVVVRTLSKAFGLAGLRVGYALGAPSLVAEIAAFGSPYAVSGISAAIACQALAGRAKVEHFVDTVVRERQELTALLDGLGAEPLPSQGNFVLATNTDAGDLVSWAASLGVGWRRFPEHSALERCVRISLPGDPDLFERLVSVLDAAFARDTIMEVADVR
jgi:histidinol-phosphate aminotransferase